MYKSGTRLLFLLQYGRSDSYRVATTQDKDEKESPKKKGGKDLDDLKKEVPIVSPHCSRPHCNLLYHLT